jgi:hypothetical protein
MEQEAINSRKNDELGNILQMLPQMMEQLRTEFELVSGKRLTANFSSAKLASLGRGFKKLYDIAQQFEAVKNKELTPVSARERLSLMNKYLRLIMRRIPKNREPLDYMIELLERLRQVPSNQDLPEGLDFTSKYDGLCIFIDKLLAVVPKSSINLFLNSGLSEHQLVPQVQRALNNLSLPKGLKIPPRRATIQTMEKLKLALHDVTTDWEALIDLVYGLVLFKDGQVPTWGNIRKVTLWDKVGKLGQEPNLAALAKPEWVTVRNVIAHGRALFIPSEAGIRFPDRKRTVFWTLAQAYLEAVDIYLANQAMLMIWNIVQTFGLTDFTEQLTQLRVLAQQ